MNVIHSALWVSDLDATEAFYIDALGLDHTRESTRDGIKNVFVAGNNGIEIQFKCPIKEEREMNPSGIDHIAIEVDDTDAIIRRLEKQTDCKVVDGPRTIEEANAHIAFVEDPDGYMLEIVQYKHQ